MSPVSKNRKKPVKKKKTGNVPLSKFLQEKMTVNYICLQCEEQEKIPLDAVRSFDIMDGGDPEVPPQFSCGTCGGIMYPEYYKGVHGYEYRIEDVSKNSTSAQ
jgi:hypothetical protein